MSNRVMNTKKESDVKYIKKVTTAKTQTTRTHAAAGSQKPTFGLACLPVRSDLKTRD